MITVAQSVEEMLLHDDVALAAARKGWLNLSSYARDIQPEIQKQLLKDIQQGTIVTALSRIATTLATPKAAAKDAIQSLSVHSSLEGMTYERSANVSARIRDIYRRVHAGDTSYLTVTQGINEVTIVAEASVARAFREELADAHKIYDKTNLVGITAKFAVGNLEIPNLIFALSRRLAYKDINIIEVVSTATELTYIIEKKDLAVALEQLQKDM
ncbi:MAG TPA: hypothetical protein VIM53_00530 [Candidatus Saccharimonadales bacterium]